MFFRTQLEKIITILFQSLQTHILIDCTGKSFAYFQLKLKLSLSRNLNIKSYQELTQNRELVHSYSDF